MAKQKTSRAYLRASDEDKRMVKKLADHLNVSQSDVWRIALKKLYDNELKPSK